MLREKYVLFFSNFYLIYVLYFSLNKTSDYWSCDLVKMTIISSTLNAL